MDWIPWRNKSRRVDSAERPLATFRDEIDQLFERMLPDPWGTRLSSVVAPRTGSFPQLDMVETEHELILQAELPGVSAEDIKIELTGNVLSLSGEKSEEKDEKRGDYSYSERRFGSFRRIVRLPAEVNSEDVDASFKDGVLRLKLVKHAGAQAKRIKVRDA